MRLAREEEAEQRRRERQSGATAAPVRRTDDSPSASPMKPTPVKTGGWRERENAKRASGAAPEGQSTPPPANGTTESPAEPTERGGTWRRGMGGRGRGGGSNTPPTRGRAAW